MGALVALTGVEHRYPSAGGGAPGPEVLRGIDLEIESGSTLAIVGPSGCGKTTLLNVIGGLEVPTAGRVEVDGRDLGALSDDERAAFRSTTVGFIFQFHHLLPQLTALENVLVPALVTGAAGDAKTVDRARELLAAVGLGERADHRPGALSGGERQRVAVVRALINRPKLVLGDEPTGSLDEAGADALARVLTDLREREGAALVVVTHSPRIAERMDRACALHEGRIKTP